MMRSSLRRTRGSSRAIAVVVVAAVAVLAALAELGGPPAVRAQEAAPAAGHPLALPDGTILGQSGQYYTVDGVQLYYEVHGDGPPLLLIHGDYAMLETWLGTIPALMEHFTVIAPERRGHGRSYDGTERFTYELFADDMAALLGHLGLERAVVVGHSGGANTALMMAYKYPDMVEKLVGMSTWFNGAGSTYDRWQATIGGPDPSWLPEEALRYWHLVNPMGAEYFPIFLQKMYDLGEYPTLTPRDLATIRTPILVVAGDRDWMRFDHTLTLFESVWRHPDPAEDARRRQLFIVPGQGHMFPYEKQELVNGVILDFLLER